MDIIVVCHTEFGIVRNRKVIATKDPDGVTEGVKNLATVASKHGAKVTYAVCPEVAEYFPKDIECEVGLHIHPGWEKFKSEGVEFYVGDDYLRKNCQQSCHSTVLRDYSFAEQLLMIREGKKHITATLGKVPTVFVSGRWSINNDTARALVRNGFTHDCSAVPHTKQGHYDWSKLPRICIPYHPDIDDYQNTKSYWNISRSPLLIVPISQMIKGGNVNPEMAWVYGVDWLKLCFHEYRLRKIPLFHMCLHSPCMVDDYYVGVLDELLRFITKHKGIEFKFASEIGEYAT